MLRDRLTRKAAAVPHREDRANLEQGLTVARHKFVEDEAPGLVVEGTEDIDHTPTIGKLSLAYQCRLAGWGQPMRRGWPQLSPSKGVSWVRRS